MSNSEIEPMHELAILKTIDASMEMHRPSAKGPELSEWQEGWNAYGLTVRDRKFAARKWFRALPDETREYVGELLASGHLYLLASDDGLRMLTNCDDLFQWSRRDSVDVGLADIPSLTSAVAADPKWGAWIWACKKRGEPPQEPVADDMKDEGAWDDELEALQLGKSES